jgi:threonine/homoserine/homoserine lactone efflux protein
MFQIMLVETAARLTPYLRARPWLPRWIDRGFGGVMIALGGKLALG